MRASKKARKEPDGMATVRSRIMKMGCAAWCVIAAFHVLMAIVTRDLLFAVSAIIACGLAYICGAYIPHTLPEDGEPADGTERDGGDNE